jgi:hypothetical protein
MPDNDFWKPGDKHLKDFIFSITPTADPIPFMLLKGHILIGLHLEQLVYNSSQTEGWNPDWNNDSFSNLLKAAKSHNLFSEDLFDALDRLNKIRNDYAHDLYVKITPNHVEFIAKPIAKDLERFSNLLNGEYSIEVHFRNILTFLFTRIIIARMAFSNSDLRAFIRKTQKIDKTCYTIEVSKEEIEKGDISSALLLSHSIGSKESVLMVMGKISLKVEGCEIDYNAFANDPKLRSYMAKLDKAFPYLLLFLELESRMVVNLFMSLAVPQSNPNGNWRYFPEDLEKFLEPRLESMNTLCEKFGLNAEAVDRAIAVKQYFSEKMG